MRKIHLNINKLIRLILLIVQIIVVGSIITYSILVELVDLYTLLYLGVYLGGLLNVLYTYSYITEKKYYTEKTKRFVVLWLFWGLTSIGCSIYNWFRYNDNVVLAIAVICLISLLIGLLQLQKYKSRYKI